MKTLQIKIITACMSMTIRRPVDPLFFKKKRLFFFSFFFVVVVVVVELTTFPLKIHIFINQKQPIKYLRNDFSDFGENRLSLQKSPS